MDAVIDWLMEGDPAIRWQAMRDLLDAPENEWQAERERTLTTGWGAQLLALQAPDGSWGGGIYSPKWISTTYTLLLLCSIGIPPTSAAGQRGARLVLNRMLGETCDAKFKQKLADCDRCIVGMITQLAVYFGIEDERIEALVENLLSERMPDGGWNCRRGRRPKPPQHSSFHTTFSVLEGLREYLDRRAGPQRGAVLEAEQGALSMMLEHHLFKSHQTGEVIDPQKKFTLLTFPYRWHYNMLRGLEYFARAAGTPCPSGHAKGAGAPYARYAPGARAARDPRLQDAIDLLLEHQREDGTWPLQYKFSGKVYFDMEKVGKPSRWVTLLALRAMRAWQDGAAKNGGNP
jgi:hypothetical protein